MLVIFLQNPRFHTTLNNPLTLFRVECMLVNHGFHVISIRSAHSALKPPQVRDGFNDPYDFLEVLVTSTACRHAIFVDVPQSCVRGRPFETGRS